MTRFGTQQQISQSAVRKNLLRAAAVAAVLLAGSCASPTNDGSVFADGLRNHPITVAPHYEAIRVAFEVGNRHFMLALDGERLLVPDDPAMDQLLTRLSVVFERRAAVFVPVGPGHRHA